jgi:hypothetical protein
LELGLVTNAALVLTALGFGFASSEWWGVAEHRNGSDEAPKLDVWDMRAAAKATSAAFTFGALAIGLLVVERTL